MIRYFNPGHEAAVWADSPFYQAPASVLKLQEDLAFLPFWYAEPGDAVWISRPLSSEFENLCKKRTVHPVLPRDLENKIDFLKNRPVDLWGISKQSIHLFEKFSEQYQLSLGLPPWNNQYKEMSSRVFAASCLSSMVNEIPGISPDLVPVFFTDLSEIERCNSNSPHKLLVKSPYSSSGRGLLWLEKPDLSRSSKQIIQGILNRQKMVSVEKVVEKTLDFSMHFVSDEFVGYSLFYTSAKGAYEKTWLASQEKIESKLTGYVSRELLSGVKQYLSGFIRSAILPYYDGNVGVDMMIYQSGGNYCLHPCVEINLRKSMGYLSLRLYQNHLHPESEGFFSVVYDPKNEGVSKSCHCGLDPQSPATRRKFRIKSGMTMSILTHPQIDLCPVYPDTKYRALLELSNGG
ncbi:hypothetical protein LJC52_02485 [Bacteroidales bacterium OttesenSCG-928-A17]|nr:hypothetical protein [Bacteroidales bacterium OttesenSCG-928-A17]